MASRVIVRNRGQEVDIDAWAKRRTSQRLRDAGAFEAHNLEDDLLNTVGTIHRRHMREQFSSEGASGGKPWADLDPDYALKKAQTYPGRKTLVANGDLRDSATLENHPEYVQRVEHRGKNVHILLGTDNFLARVHSLEGVRRRLDKKPKGSGGGRRQRTARRAASSGRRKRPTFRGSYEFVKRSIIERTREQIAEFREAMRDYFDRRLVAPVREGFQSNDRSSGIRIGPTLGG